MDVAREGYRISHNPESTDIYQEHAMDTLYNAHCHIGT